MNNGWHTLQDLKERGPNSVSAETTLGPDSLWFDGHFPGFPILPGIAQLALVSDMLKKHARQKGRTISVSEIRKVRFRQFVRPNDTLEILSAPDEQEPGVYKFKIMVKGQVACNGVIATVPRN